MNISSNDRIASASVAVLSILRDLPPTAASEVVYDAMADLLLRLAQLAGQPLPDSLPVQIRDRVFKLGLPQQLRGVA